MRFNDREEAVGRMKLWMEDPCTKAFFEFMVETRGNLVKKLIIGNDEEVRGRIKQLDKCLGFQPDDLV